MSRDLQLLGRAKRTHDGYLREVRKLACYFNQSPDQLSQRQVADYLLYLINDKHFAPGSLKVAYSALKFFYTTTCPRDWNILDKLKVPKQTTLPDVLTIKQVHQLIASTKQFPVAIRIYGSTSESQGAKNNAETIEPSIVVNSSCGER